MFFDAGGVSYRDDPKNYNNSRNIDNTRKETYNCAGYALNCFSWYCPVPDSDLDPEDYLWGSEDADECEALTECFVEQILIDFPDVRIISSIADLQPDEYALAFRVGENDFHFVKRGNNGHWYEKRGNQPIIRPMTEEEVFHENWGAWHEYYGRIVLMAKKRVNAR